MIIVKVEKHTGRVEGEWSSRFDRAPHRPIREIRAIRGSLQKLDHGWHGFHGLSAAQAKLISVVPCRTMSGQSIRRRPRIFLKLRARGETKLSSRKSLISKIGLMQVVDFHVIFRYFPCFFSARLVQRPSRTKAKSPKRKMRPPMGRRSFGLGKQEAWRVPNEFGRLPRLEDATGNSEFMG
jgi:hypothetical protein